MKSPGGKYYASTVSKDAAPSAMPPWPETVVVGKRIPRVDGFERTSGTAVYTLDMHLPEMLYGAILRCPHANAIVKSVNTSRAERMPGVGAIIKDGSRFTDVPFFPGPDGKPTSRLFDKHCRHEGEEVAAVAAETPQQAWDALRAIEVEYEVLPFASDGAAASSAGSVRIHEYGNTAGEPRLYSRGDVNAGYAAAHVVMEQEYQTACEIHTPLEAHVSVAQWDGSRLTVWDSSQGVYDAQIILAQALGLPLSSVRIISQYIGGGFGSKGDELNKHTVIAALLARMCKRPVKVALSREDTFLCVGNRPAGRLWLKAGVKKNGELTAMHLSLVEDGGAYMQQYPGQVTGFVADVYLCPNVKVEEHYRHINAGTGRPFRAPGYVQAAWAVEQMMDSLAERIGMDPIEFRMKNVPAVSQWRKGRPYTSTGLAKCLSEGAKAFGWKAARETARNTGAIRRGVGVACCNWGYPGEPLATAFVKVFADGSINLNTGAADIGTGTKTVLAMVVAEELGVPPSAIQIELADTGTTQYAPISGGSQTVVSNAPAVRAAAVDARDQILQMASEELNQPAANLRLKEGKIYSRDSSKPIDLLSLRGMQGYGKGKQVVVGVGRREPHPAGKVPLPFAAHFAEVEVNVRTGEVRVTRLLGAHDSGRVMNELTYENQVFGGMTMGLGFALTERRVLDARQTGKMVNANWHDYKLPTAADAPVAQTCLAIDPHDTECNSTGAKGLGEPATIPTAAAIANAVYHATGVRVSDTPISPMRMLRLLAGSKSAGAHAGSRSAEKPLRAAAISVGDHGSEPPEIMR